MPVGDSQSSLNEPNQETTVQQEFHLACIETSAMEIFRIS